MLTGKPPWSPREVAGDVLIVLSSVPFGNLSSSQPTSPDFGIRLQGVWVSTGYRRPSVGLISFPVKHSHGLTGEISLFTTVSSGASDKKDFPGYAVSRSWLLSGWERPGRRLRGSQSLSLRQSHPAQQSDVARIGADRIPERIGLEKNSTGGVRVRAFESCKGLVFVS